MKRSLSNLLFSLIVWKTCVECQGTGQKEIKFQFMGVEVDSRFNVCFNCKSLGVHRVR